MRFSPFVLLCAAALFAQAPATTPPPAPELAPDAVIASFEGKKLTFGQLKAFIGLLDPQQQQQAARNPKMLVHQYFLWQHLAALALDEKLDEKSPTREQLAYNRTFILMQSKLNDVVRNVQVDEDELKKYYEANKDKYSQVKVKAIYISFSTNPAEAGSAGKKVLNEEEAKAKIEKVLAEIRGGADFVKKVKEYSEDVESRDKDGDLGTFRRSDSLPDAIRGGVFKLKQGEVSEPVRQPNGFYLFLAEQLTTRTYQQEQMSIYEQARQAKAQKWMNDLNASINFKVENEAFFNAPAPAGVPSPPPPAGTPPASH